MAPKQNKATDKAKLASKQKVAITIFILCDHQPMDIHSL